MPGLQRAGDGHAADVGAAVPGVRRQRPGASVVSGPRERCGRGHTHVLMSRGDCQLSSRRWCRIWASNAVLDWTEIDFAALASAARRLPGFRLRMGTEVTGLVSEVDRVVGVEARTAEGRFEARANLVVGTDGRGSTVRAGAGLEVIDSGAPIDVLWFRVTRRSGDPPEAGGTYYIGARQFMVLMPTTCSPGGRWSAWRTWGWGRHRSLRAPGCRAIRRETRWATRGKGRGSVGILTGI